MPAARRRAPLIAGVVAALVAVAAVLVWQFVDLSDDESTGTPKAGSRVAANTFTADEVAAIGAAQTEAANLLSFRRANFDADLKRALDGATGSVVNDIRTRAAQVKKTITDGKFDLVAKVTHTALLGPVDDDKVKGYVVLVSLNGFRSDNLNTPTAQQNLRVTVVDKSGKWLVNQVDSIGVTG